MESAKVYRLNRNRISVSQAALTASASSPATKPKLLDQVRQAIRTLHYSYMTEKAYVHWIKRFIFFHDKRHPDEMGEAEIGQFLSSLALTPMSALPPRIKPSMPFYFSTVRF